MKTQSAEKEIACSDSETDFFDLHEDEPENWSYQTRINKSDPKIVQKILSCLIGFDFKCKFQEMKKSDIQKIIQALKKHKITFYDEKKEISKSRI